MNTPRSLRFAALLCVVGSAALFARDDEADVVAVIAAEKARGAALVAADLPALDRFFAEDLRMTHSNGKIQTKNEFLGDLRNGMGYERFETSELHGHAIAPDVIVLTGRIDQRKGMHGVYSGKDPKLIFQAVWRRESTGWRLASMQTAALPADPAPGAAK